MSSRKRQIVSNPNLGRGFLGVFAYSRRAMELVWTTSRPLSFAFGLLTIAAGALPATAGVGVCPNSSWLPAGPPR